VYTIRIVNVGDIAGYATQITDFAPPGMRFVPEKELNISYGWERAGEDRVETRILASTRLEPGEYADIQISMRWINDGDNLGLRRNVARITDTYNDYGIPDTNPYNDEDDAWIILERETFGLDILAPIAITTSLISILAAGIFLIKRHTILQSRLY